MITVVDSPERSLPSVPAHTAILGFLGIVGIYAVILVAAIVIGMMTIFRSPTFIPTSPSTYQYAVAWQIASYAPIAVFALWLMRRRSSLPSFGLRRFGLKELPTITGGILALIVATELLSAIEKLFVKGRLQPNLFGPHPSSGVTLAIVLMAVILAPFAEEVFFRGIVFNALRGRLSVWPASIISGIIFAGAHLEPNAVLPLLGAGIILAFVYERTNNIFASMICHATLNAIGITEMLVFHQV
jgi:membrane protease YdiL (CAAX protease family)